MLMCLCASLDKNLDLVMMNFHCVRTVVRYHLSAYAVAEGVELQLDTAKHPLNVDQLLAIQQSVAEILRRTSNDGANARQKGEQA